MPWPSELVLVRHAESEGNILSVNERASFNLATHAYPLTEKGRRQAVITGQFIFDTYGDFDIYYVSYYRRSMETMELMFPYAKLYEDPRLAEAQRGIWHAMTREEIRQYYPGEIIRKEREGLYHYRPFGGENWPDVELRIHSFLGTLSRDYGKRKVIIVVHGHWLILFQRLIHHFSIDEALKKYREAVSANASVTVYRSFENDGWSRLHLTEINNFVPWQGKI